MRTLSISACLFAISAAVLLSDACCEVARGEEIVEQLQLHHQPESNERNAHVAQIADFAFLPDGTLLTGGADGSLRHWDLETGQQLQLLAQQASPITRVAVSPDGRRALSFSAIGAIRVWQLPAAKGKGDAPASGNGRYQLTTHVDSSGVKDKLFLLDTQTGSIWERDVASGSQKWKEIGPKALMRSPAERTP